MKSVLLTFAVLQLVVVISSSYQFLNNVADTCGKGDEVKDCSKPGPFCETCTHLVLCVDQGDHYVKIDQADCSVTGLKCVVNECTDIPDPVCDGTACLPFVCGDTGAFPDPFYFDRYHMCIKDENRDIHYSINCEEGYLYNPKTTYCDIPRKDNGTIEGYPLPICTSNGQMGAVETNPTLYYLCAPYNDTLAVIYPFQYSCPAGGIFDSEGCEEK